MSILKDFLEEANMHKASYSKNKAMMDWGFSRRFT